MEERASAWTVMATDRREERAKMAAAPFALVLSLPVLFVPLRFPSSPPEGRRRGRGRGGHDGRTSRRCLVVAGCWSIGGEVWRCGGDVVAIASPRSGRGGRPSLTLGDVASGRSGEWLEMVWTVETSDGAEEARNWQKMAEAYFALVLSLPSLLHALLFFLALTT